MSDYPTVRPSLNLNFARTKKLDPRVTFRRASTGTYVDSDGLIKTAGIDTPRFDHDPVTGVCKGLLVEESRQNLLTYSEQFDNGYWSLLDVNITPNSAVAPDGTTTADFISANTNNAVHGLRSSIFSVISQTTYTFTIYVKPFGSVVSIGLNIGSSTSFGGGSYGSGTIINFSSQTPDANGWYRVSYTNSSGAGAANPRVSIFIRSSNAFVGGDSSGIYIWGAQLEAGAFPTSYIPTVASTVTRSADLASMTGTNFSSWYNQSEGTIFTRLALANSSLNGFSISDRTVNNRIFLDMNSTNKRFGIISAGVTLANITRPYTASAITNSAGAYAVNDFQFCEQGTLGTPDNDGSLPISLNSLYIGANAAGLGGYANGTISRITYWPKRLPDAQLQALTRP